MHPERLKNLSKALPQLKGLIEYTTWMEDLLEAHEEKYKVAEIGPNRQGFNLIPHRSDLRTFIEVTFSRTKIRAEHVDNFAGTMVRLKIRETGLLIAPNGFANSAIEAAESWAETHRILLIDLPHLQLLASGKVAMGDWLAALISCHRKTDQHLISVHELQPSLSALQSVSAKSVPKLKEILISGVGHFESIAFSPLKRMNLITGENGLGKSFLLECLWWAHSGRWSGRPAYPRNSSPRIDFTFSNPESSKEDHTQADYDSNTHTWCHLHPQEHSLVLYVGANNQISVWDPIKGKMPVSVGTDQKQSPLVFSPTQVWDGIRLDNPDTWLSNGLLRDWVRWQSSETRLPFATLEAFLSCFSPQNEPLQAGDIMRLPDDARDQPTIRYSYGNVPLALASEGVRRILSLAYMIVWLWHEHRFACKATNRLPLKAMVVLIDEIEAHIHPRWQPLLPAALLGLAHILDFELNIQFFVTTHSPLIAASLEPQFDPEKDGLFHFHQDESGMPNLKQLSFIKHGRVDQWYTSDVFGLPLARSLEAERAIKEAEQLQLEKKPDSKEVRKLSKALKKVLSDQDSFWPTCTWFAKQNGVDL
jgi:hypothetical protein